MVDAGIFNPITEKELEIGDEVQHKDSNKYGIVQEIRSTEVLILTAEAGEGPILKTWSLKELLYNQRAMKGRLVVFSTTSSRGGGSEKEVVEMARKTAAKKKAAKKASAKPRKITSGKALFTGHADGYMGHRKGSKMEAAHKLFDKKGRDAKEAIEKLGVASSTANTWLYRFANWDPKAGPSKKKAA